MIEPCFLDVRVVMEIEEKHLLDLQRLGKRIRTLREERHYSQETLGFKADLHRTYVSQLELGQRNPSYTTLLKLASALSIDIVELVSKENVHVIKSEREN